MEKVEQRFKNSTLTLSAASGFILNNRPGQNDNLEGECGRFTESGRLRSGKQILCLTAMGVADIFCSKAGETAARGHCYS